MDIITLIFLFTAIAAASIIAFIYSKQSLVSGIANNLSKVKKRTDSNTKLACDYKVYHMNFTERAKALALSAAVLIFVGYIFYRSIFLALMLVPFSLLYPRVRTRQLIERRKYLLRLQFKDSLQALSSSLQAGRSVETAIKSAVADLLIEYEEDSYIVREFEIIARKLESNKTIEQAFRDFADRSDLEEIKVFAEMLDACKRTGGNLVTAIKSSSEIIADKVEVMHEIQGVLSEKKLEQRILTIMPIVLILLLSSSAGDFMKPVFTELAGRAAMTVSIVLFAVAYIIAGKITDIEV